MSDMEPTRLNTYTIESINLRIKHGVTAQTLRDEGVWEGHISMALHLADKPSAEEHLAYQEEG